MFLDHTSRKFLTFRKANFSLNFFELLQQSDTCQAKSPGSAFAVIIFRRGALLSYLAFLHNRAILGAIIASFQKLCMW